MTQVILVSGTTWTPSDFSGTTDKVECLGPGSIGVAATNSTGGDGGGASAYAQKLSYAASSSTSVPIAIGAANSGTDTFFDSATTGIMAKAATANSRTGGTAAASIGTTKFDGGTGGAHQSSLGGGGAGSGGPAGAGTNGPTPVASAVAGGAANNSTDAGGAASGGNAVGGTEFDATHGCGPGGGGATSGANNGGNGANYGGGGGGAGSSGVSHGTNGTAGAGIIVVNYTSVGSITSYGGLFNPSPMLNDPRVTAIGY